MRAKDSDKYKDNCPKTHRTAEWPYISRCVKKGENHTDHIDMHGNEWND